MHAMNLLTMNLLRCAHIGPCIAVTGITTALAVSSGRGVGALWVAAAVLAGQLSVGWANDWLDAGRDRAAGRGDKPIVAGTVAVGTVRTAALVALAACATLSLACGLRATAVHLLAVGVAWGYDAGLKGTPVSVAPYAIAFGLLPAFVTLGEPAHRLPAGWATVAAALLGAGAHFTNALPDLDVDARTGVRGLPQRLGGAGSLATAVALLAAAGLVLVVGPPRAPGSGVVLTAAIGGVLLLGVVAAAVGGRPRTAFRLTIGVALAMTATLLLSGTRLR
jgi:4-hydroxybenzoate polyprenyltransferase